MTNQRQPLYEVEGKPVYEGDVLHCHPSLFSRAGLTAKAYRESFGGRAVMQSPSGAVPTVDISLLSWEPHPEAIAILELETAGFRCPSFRDVQIWIAAKIAAQAAQRGGAPQ